MLITKLLNKDKKEIEHTEQEQKQTGARIHAVMGETRSE